MSYYLNNFNLLTINPMETNGLINAIGVLYVRI